MIFISGLAFAIIIYIIHEAGHYYIAKLFGWKPKVKFIQNGWRTGFGIEVSEEVEIETIEEIPKICKKLLYFSAAGSLSIIPVYLFSFFIDQDLSPVVILLLMYSLYETLVTTDFSFLKQLQIADIPSNNGKEDP